jgi:ribosomal subunit interface protein
MQITISGKHMETGTALKSHVDEALGAGVSKYFANAISADVIFSKLDHLFHCHITVNEGVKDGTVIASDSKAENVYTAFNGALEKAEKQLRRYKRKLKDRSHNIPLKELSLKVANG